MNRHGLLDEPDLDDWRCVRVVLVRHGESRGNAAARFEGQTGPGLTELGRAQAAAAADGLLRRYGTPDEVLASDLVRVTETAAPYLALTGLPTTTDVRLREAAVGTWSGRTFVEVAAVEPEAIRAVRRGEDIRRGGGETFADLRARVTAALADAVGAFRDAPSGSTRTLVVFTHGGPIRVATAAAVGLPAGGHRTLDPPPNCSSTELEFVLAPAGAPTARLVAYNSPAPALPEAA